MGFDDKSKVGVRLMQWLTSWGYLIAGVIGVIAGSLIIYLYFSEGGGYLGPNWRGFAAMILGPWLFYKGWLNLKEDKKAEMTKLGDDKDNG